MALISICCTIQRHCFKNPLLGLQYTALYWQKNCKSRRNWSVCLEKNDFSLCRLTWNKFRYGRVQLVSTHSTLSIRIVSRIWLGCFYSLCFVSVNTHGFSLNWNTFIELKPFKLMSLTSEMRFSKLSYGQFWKFQ